jgi:hypothetical protein
LLGKPRIERRSFGSSDFDRREDLWQQFVR